MIMMKRVTMIKPRTAPPTMRPNVVVASGGAGVGSPAAASLVAASGDPRIPSLVSCGLGVAMKDAWSCALRVALTDLKLTVTALATGEMDKAGSSVTMTSELSIPSILATAKRKASRMYVVPFSTVRVHVRMSRICLTVGPEVGFVVVVAAPVVLMGANVHGGVDVTGGAGDSVGVDGASDVDADVIVLVGSDEVVESDDDAFDPDD